MDNTLGGSGRARYDPTRKQGNANTLAQGGEITTTSVISQTELDKWTSIAMQSPRAAAEAHREAQAERQARSKARCEAWPNTLEALRMQGEQARDAARLADEARRVAIDEEEAQLREAKRQQVVQAANLRLLHADERGMQLRKAIHLHTVLQGQEEQRRIKAEKSTVQALEQAQYAAEVRTNAQAEIDEKRAAQERLRQENAATKAAQLAFLEQQVLERRHARESEANEREMIRLGAEEEALKKSTQELETRMKNVQLKQLQVDQVLSSPRTPRERLQLRVEEGQRSREEEAKYLADRAVKQRALDEIQQQRYRYHASLIESATGTLQQVHTAPSPRDKAAASFADSPSFVTRMLSENDHREATHKQHRRDLAASTTLSSPRSLQQTYHSQRDEVLSSPAYRQRLDHQIQMLDKFDAEAAAKKREELEYLRKIQRMQAEEKKVQAAQEAEAQRQEVAARKQALEEEDALFRNFVDQHMPSNVSPRIHNMATKAPMAHLR